MSDIHNISIKWKLIIPFLLLALCGTSILIFLSIRFQERTFLFQERNHLECLHHSFVNKITESSSLALTLAREVAMNTCLKKALAQNDLNKLKQFCLRSHKILRSGFTSLGWYFLLVDEQGEILGLFPSTNKIPSQTFLKDWFKTKKPRSGLALAGKSLVIWGAVPVNYDKKIVGACAMIIPVDRPFLMSFTSIFKVHYTIISYSIDPEHRAVLSTTEKKRVSKTPDIYKTLDKSLLPYFRIAPESRGLRATMITLLKDYKNDPVAFLQISADRTRSLKLLSEYKKNMILVGAISFILSLGIIYWITVIFTRPIAKLVRAAREIAEGRKIKEIKLSYRDEIGMLADSLNEMLKSLEESHLRIRDYAENLEKKVRERTRALTQSEEKYRTLVENVPLVVYRTSADGTLTFVNKQVEDLLGCPLEKAMQEKDFFLSRIVDEDKEAYLKHWKECLEKARKFEIEYRMVDKDNQVIYVVDRAIPEVGKDGKVKSVDGIIVDITDRKKAQEKILQAEELRALREISSRLAHEIRNPLTIAGGFARHLLKSFPEDDPRRKKLEIIAGEIEKLENILKTTLEYIKPRVLIFKETNLNELIRPLLEKYQEEFSKRGVVVEVDFDPSIPDLQLDRDLFYQATGNILELLLSLLPPETSLRIQTYTENRHVILAMTIEGAELKMEQFEPLLSPFSSSLEKGLPLGLPLTKIIVEKHKGLLKIEKLGKRLYSITISLPIS